MDALAAAEKIEGSYLCRILQLAHLAPSIVEGDPRRSPSTAAHGERSDEAVSARLEGAAMVVF